MTNSKGKNGPDDSHMQLKKLRIRMRRLEFGLFIAAVVILLLILTQIVTSRFTVTNISTRVQDMEDGNLILISKLEMLNEELTLLSQEQKSFEKEMREEQNVDFKKVAQFENKMKTNEKKKNQFVNVNLRNERAQANQFAKEKQVSVTDKNKKPMIGTGSIQTTEMITNTSKNDRSLLLKKEKVGIENGNAMITQIQRNLKLNLYWTQCLSNLFELNVQFDMYPEETTWELFNIQTQDTIAYENYNGKDPYSNETESICLEDGSYIFTIFDSFSDGMCDGYYDFSSDCHPYEILINNEIFVVGNDFVTEESHTFRIKNGVICLGNLIETEIVIDENESNVGGGWSLTNTRTAEVLSNFTSSQNDLICVENDVFLFSLLNRDTILNTTNGIEFGYMKITVNGIILMDGSLLSEYLFYISDDDVGKYDCTQNPMLDPFNNYSPNMYDERTAEMLTVFRKLSSFDDIQNNDATQYKAACYILVEDMNKLTVQDPLMIERYVLSLLLISTGMITNTDEIPLESCDYPGVLCDRDGFIIGLDFCKCYMVEI